MKGQGPSSTCSFAPLSQNTPILKGKMDQDPDEWLVLSHHKVDCTFDTVGAAATAAATPVTDLEVDEATPVAQWQTLKAVEKFQPSVAARRGRRPQFGRTADRLYTCITCNASFKRSDHLKRHKLVHINAREYECRRCHQRFARRDNRDDHERASCSQELINFF